MLRLSLLPPAAVSVTGALLAAIGGVLVFIEMIAFCRLGEYRLPGGLPIRRRERPGKFFALLLPAMAIQIVCTAGAITLIWFSTGR